MRQHAPQIASLEQVIFRCFSSYDHSVYNDLLAGALARACATPQRHFRKPPPRAA